MKKLKRIILGLGLVLCASINTAHAKHFYLGTLDAGELYSVSNVVGDRNMPGDGFSDAWGDEIHFSIAEDSLITSTVFNFSYVVGGAIDNFLLQLINVTDGANDILIDTTPLSQYETYTTSLEAGNYIFNLVGNGSDVEASGVYALTISSVSPVPELPLYAMMISGLAVMGVKLRRKS